MSSESLDPVGDEDVEPDAEDECSCRERCQDCGIEWGGTSCGGNCGFTRNCPECE